MKKMIKILTIALICIIILVYSPTVFSNIVFTMPKEMKNEDVCFFIPELTWSNSFNELEKHFGQPIEKGKYNNVTGTKTNIYKTTYEKHSMTVSATRYTFPKNTSVFDYDFIIACTDLEDSNKIFNDLSNKLKENNSTNTNFKYEYIDDNTASFSICYGPTGIYYNLDYNNENVILTAHCQY